MVLFDWNNTIANDFVIWWQAVEETFRAFGGQAPTVREYFDGLKGDYLELYRQRGVSASREELNGVYESFYENHINEITLFSEVKEILRFLSKQGIIIGLVTQQKEFLIFPVLEKYGLKKLFSYCECHALSKTIAICQILKKESMPSQNCFFIGDAPSDINHGKKAGVKTIAFLNGYVPEDLVVAAKPDFFVRNLREIKKIIREVE